MAAVVDTHNTTIATQAQGLFDTARALNEHTEAVNGVVETIRRVARGFRNFDNYRLRALFAAGGYRPWRSRLTPA